MDGVEFTVARDNGVSIMGGHTVEVGGARVTVTEVDLSPPAITNAPGAVHSPAHSPPCPSPGVPEGSRPPTRSSKSAAPVPDSDSEDENTEAYGGAYHGPVVYSPVPG